MERFTTVADEPLAGDVDLEAVLREIPDDHDLKGMFFARYVNALGEAWAQAENELLSPPSRGRYHAFDFYPLTDYLRLFDRVARARFPGSTREAYRLLARGEVDVFGESTLGKVTFTLLRDPAVALLRYPEAFGVLARGPRAKATRSAERAVRIDFVHYRGAIEYAVGVLEGLVVAFDERPSVDVSRGPTDATLIVSW